MRHENSLEFYFLTMLLHKLYSISIFTMVYRTQDRYDYQDSTNYLFNSPVSLPSTGNFVFTDTARALVIQSTEYIQLREGFVASAGELCGKYVLELPIALHCNQPLLSHRFLVTVEQTELCNSCLPADGSHITSNGITLVRLVVSSTAGKRVRIPTRYLTPRTVLQPAPVQIAEPAELVIDAHRVSPTCNLSNGSISLSCTGGSGPYIYDWIGYDSEDR